MGPAPTEPGDRSRTDGSASRLRSLVHALGPDSLLLDPDTRILAVRGDIDAFVGLSSKGTIDATALSLLKEPWSHDVRVGVPAALRDGAVHEGVARPHPGRAGHRSRVLVYPMHDEVEDERTALVVFRTWPEAVPELARSDGDGVPDDAARAIETLTRELELARANLALTSEELDVSNRELNSIAEEMQATNEELQSANEEMQSTNEELETSSEELQSTNEELSTVNDELRISSQQLSETNRRQRSILDNVVAPMIVVDERLRVVDASLSATGRFGVPADLTEPHLSYCRPPDGFPPLERFVGEAIARGEPSAVEVRTDEINAALTAAPYQGPDGTLLGAIVQIVDGTDALREAVAQLELIFEHVPVALALCDHQGRVVTANANAHRWLGLESPALVGRAAHEHLPEELARKLAELDRGALDSGDMARGDGYLLEIEGLEPKWVRTTHVPFAHSGRSMLLLMSEDLTRQHEQERRSEHFRTRLKLALEASDIGTWDWDLERREGFWSDRVKEILGVDGDIEPGFDAVAERVHPHDREAYASAVRERAGHDEPWSLRTRIVRDDGEVRWISVRGRRTTDDDGGHKLIGTLSDETELVARLERLAAMNEHLRLAERLSETGYWQLDLGEPQRLHWSDQVYAIHGLDPETHVPNVEEALTFYHPEDRARVSALVGEAIENAAGFEFTARVTHADGGYRRVKSLGIGRRDEVTGTSHLFGVFSDITDLTAREQYLAEARDELARSNEELARFSYVCSHDMKEPVRLIESMAGLLLTCDPAERPGQTRALLARIKTNTGRLRAIIDGLLAYSRVEARVETGPVDLAQVAAEVRDTLSLRIAEQNAELEIGELPVVHGARVHFAQLLQNLVGNALAYSDAERPRVRIGARAADGGIELAVEDNGPGIAPEQRGRVFDVFTRLELDSAVEGTGLGLSICQRIARQYGGTIECADSELGGVAIVIRLPDGGVAGEPERGAHEIGYGPASDPPSPPPPSP